MNDVEAPYMISAFVGIEEGILSKEMAKQLVDKNTKYSEEFRRNLLKE